MGALAASHAGLLLEFDAHHDFFHQQLSADDELRRIRRVVYCDTRPSRALTSMDAADLFLFKSTHWAYEREWRMLLPFDRPQTMLPATPYAIHLFSFPRAALTAIVLGARASLETRAAVEGILKDSPDYSHVAVRHVQLDESHFLLRIVDGAI